MSPHPTWFGPPDRPVFGWLHLPTGRRARAAIVLCPSIGTEATASHRSLRLLATELEGAGFAVLRFDYGGTGDSADGWDDDAQVGAWRASVCEGVRYVRSLGLRGVGAVGLRIGATLAALEASADGGIDALALWDPCPHGRGFVREQLALAALTLDPGDTAKEADSPLEPGSAELLGWVLGPSARSELESLSLAEMEPPAPSCLVLIRDDRQPARAIRSWEGHPAVQWASAVGQGRLIDVLPNEAEIPFQTITAIVGWMDRVMPQELHPVKLNCREQATFRTGGIPAVEETALRLGELGLFAMVTEPSGRKPSATVLLLNAGVIPHTGPARLWVSLARRLASSGLRVVRLDLSGLGESPVRVGQKPHLTHPLEAMEDIEVALVGLGLEPGDVVVAGSCSGAYHAIEAGLRLPLRGVCAINPVLAYEPPEAGSAAQVDWERQAVVPFNGMIKYLRRFPRVAEWGEFHSPPVLWWLLDRVGLQAHPARSLEALASRSVPVALLCGEVEARPFLRRARWSLWSLIRRGAVAFDLLEGADHNLFGAPGRIRAELLILHRLLELAGRNVADAPFEDEAGSLLMSRDVG